MWTGDLDFFELLREPIDAALSWIDRYGDLDGDGFVEYRRRSRQGLLNQGWRDSHNAIVHADGSIAEGPIALGRGAGLRVLRQAAPGELFGALGDIELVRAPAGRGAGAQDALQRTLLDGGRTVRGDGSRRAEAAR